MSPDPVLDEHGPTIDLTWRQYAELIRLLDRAMEFEDEAGWSTRSLRDMADLLVAKCRAYEATRARRPSSRERAAS